MQSSNIESLFSSYTLLVDHLSLFQLLERKVEKWFLMIHGQNSVIYLFIYLSKHKSKKNHIMLLNVFSEYLENYSHLEFAMNILSPEYNS